MTFNRQVSAGLRAFGNMLDAGKLPVVSCCGQRSLWALFLPDQVRSCQVPLDGPIRLDWPIYSGPKSEEGTNAASGVHVNVPDNTIRLTPRTRAGSHSVACGAVTATLSVLRVQNSVLLIL